MKSRSGGGVRQRNFLSFLILVMFVSAGLAGLLMQAPVTSAQAELDYIIIRTAPGDGGDWVGETNYSLGDTDTFYAAGYNDTTGYIGEVDVWWQVTDPYVGEVTDYGNSTTFTTVGPGATVVVANISEGSDIRDIENHTGILSVFNNTIDYIKILDAPHGGGVWVGDRIYKSGDLDTFYSAGYNNITGYEGDFAAVWTGDSPNVCAITRSEYNPGMAEFKAFGPGTCTITADFGGGRVNSTGMLTIAQIDDMVIRDAPDGGGAPVENRTYYLGDTDTFYAAGYNNTFGYLGELFAHWYSELIWVGIVYPEFGTSVTFEAVGGGTTWVFAYCVDPGGTGCLNTTGTLTVISPLDSIIIRNATGGGGEWVGDRTYNVGEADTFYAAGYNDTTGYIGDISVRWSSTDSQVGSVTKYGNSTIFTAVSAGSVIVTASYPADTTQPMIENQTGTITVIYRPIDYIIIRDAAHGEGEWIDDRTYYEGDEDIFYAAGYNNAYGYQGDFAANWTSDNASVCNVTSFGASTIFNAAGGGTCKVTAEFKGKTNMTGTLTVLPVITVDDSGGADYFTIQEAIDAADPGGRIFVYKGIYYEHVNVYKPVKIKGEDRDETIIDGSGTGIVVLITANNVDIQKFTVRNGEYGIFLDKSEGTTISYNLVKNYDYGIYNNYTKDCYIAHNEITSGKYGIVTDHAHNDAVRWNTISYNSVYGAKDFNSQLKNCFNWNHFHHNKIAYWYDPTEELSELEFDGNLIEHNEIGVKVSDASTVRITNNTITDGYYGIYIENASPWIYRNILENNIIGIYVSNSNSSIEENTITDSEYGIYCVNSSPRILGNTIDGISIHGIFVENAAAIEISGNTVQDMIIYNSTVEELSLTATDTTAINSTILNFNFDLNSKLTAKWYLRIRVEDANGNIVKDAMVKILDVSGNEVEILETGLDGRTEQVALTEYVHDSQGQTYHTPHMITAEKGDAKCEESVSMNENRYLVLTIKKPALAVGGFPWLLLLIVIGSVTALGIGGLLATGIGKYTLISLLVPLYLKLKKEDVLEHYDRGRIYQYIELNPGDHYNSIKRGLGMNSGTLTYHLYVLEKTKKIKSRREGIYKRFYPYNAMIPQNNGGLTEVQKRIVDSIRDLPDASQKELASVLGLHQSTLSYQLAKLESMGVISSTRTRRNVHYYINE